MLYHAVGTIVWHQPAGGIRLAMLRPVHHRSEWGRDRGRFHGSSARPAVPAAVPAASSPMDHRVMTLGEAWKRWKRIALWWTFGPAQLGRMVPETRAIADSLEAS